MSAAAMSAQRLNVVVGIPDDRAGRVAVDPVSNLLRVTTDGTANISSYFPKQGFAAKIVNIDPAPSVPVRFEPGPILNQIADPDRCGRSLEKLAAAVAESGRACFNHPRAILATDRLSVAQKLSGIDGLHVPQTLRLTLDDTAALHEEIAAAGLQYPVLARVAGDHGGVSLLKIDSREELPTLCKLNAHGKAIYLTAFHDFVSADGRYRQFRIVVVGDRFFLRHLLVGDSWLLHSKRRGAGTEEEEAQMLEGFDSTLGPRVAPIVKEITRRLDLDYYGIDCHVPEDGEMTLFEANACMNILFNNDPSNMWHRPNERIKDALFSLLKRPGAWRDRTGRDQIA
jgi:glutathione synthase/RimK-type ligase-like ATP-grasp enzyme